MATILVVDDERNIREHLATFLRGLGHQVETAAEATQALAALGRHSTDVVFSDVRMAGMDGLALLREVHVRHPETVVVLNRSGAEAQVQGSVIDALSVMMGQRIDIEDGRVQQSNFHEYPLLRMPAAPPEVHAWFIESDRSPTGCGEPALPPLAPAVCNAIFTLTNERVRELPEPLVEERLQVLVEGLYAHR